MGRSADQVLAGKHKIFRVFITSSKENRIKRIMKRDSLTKSDAKKKISKVDKERSLYYNQRSEKRWGDAAGYDLCIDTDWFGIDGATSLIVEAVKKQ